jgi:aspartate aminotransferase
MVEEFRNRRAKVMELMKGIQGFEFAEPDGAFYAFPCVDYYFGKSMGEYMIKDADDLAMYLLNVANVSTVTGSAFGDDKCLRISFANSMQNIHKGFERIKQALNELV